MWFGLVTGFTEHLQNVTTNNYDILTELHTPKITISQCTTVYYLSFLTSGANATYKSRERWSNDKKRDRYC
jgi:hypothetical protein